MRRGGTLPPDDRLSSTANASPNGRMPKLQFTIASKPTSKKTRKSMTDDAFMSYWEKRNDELRNLGIKTVGLEQD